MRYALILLGVLALSIGMISPAYSQTEQIPSWVKNVFAFYAQGHISDAELLGAIEYLIDIGIIAVSEPTMQDSGDFYLTYGSAPEGLEDYKDWIISQDYFERQMVFLNDVFNLPHDVKVAVESCDGEANAVYYPDTKTIEICYEYIEEADVRFYEHGITYADEAVLNVIDYTFYHELGHALIDVYELPYTGPNEDAADQFASYMMTEYTEHEIGQAILADVAYDYIVLHDKYGMESALYADTHSLNIQRFYNIACFAYGYDPVYNHNLVEDGILPEDRAGWCEEEYNHAVRGWDYLLAPYVKYS